MKVLSSLVVINVFLHEYLLQRAFNSKWADRQTAWVHEKKLITASMTLTLSVGRQPIIINS